VWYAKWREPGGRQVKRRIGPAWTGRGRPPTGFCTKRTAETWLGDELRALDALAAAGADLDMTFAHAAHARAPFCASIADAVVFSRAALA
jgi:hypothetical protein